MHSINNKKPTKYVCNACHGNNPAKSLLAAMFHGKYTVLEEIRYYSF